MGYGLEYIELQVTKGGRNAFYKMALVKKPSGLAVLVKQWGKIGTKGQTKLHHGSAAQLREELNLTADAKGKKSYRRVDALEMDNVSDPNDIHNRLINHYGLGLTGLNADELSDLRDDPFETPEELLDEPAVEPERPSGWGDW